MTYAEQLQNPLWQRKRLEILHRDKFTCQICLYTETNLHVHHKEYDKTYQTLAWQYPDHNYITLCSDCHKALTDHLKEYGNDKEFNVMKVKRSNAKPVVFVYSNGKIIFNTDDATEITLTENTTHDIVQFLINNWLKNE